MNAASIWRSTKAKDAGFATQVGQLRRPFDFDAIGVEQRKRQGARAAAIGANRDAPAAQFGQFFDRSRVSVKDVQRLVKKAAQRDQAIRLDATGQTALHETDVDLDVRIEQALQVFLGTCGRKTFSATPLCARIVWYLSAARRSALPSGPLVMMSVVGGAGFR